jgi:hypothetical protein
LAVFLRGQIWWYEFEFHGKRIRESSHSRSESLAKQLEHERRKRLEIATHDYRLGRRSLLFRVAARDWLDTSRAHWSESTIRIQQYNLVHLLPFFGDRPLSEIATDEISRYQAARKAEGVSKRAINMEVSTFRAVLRKARLWNTRIQTTLD